MAEIITGEYIKSAVVKKLAEEFPNIKIYKEKIVQGMCTPCFFVLENDVIQSKQMKNICQRTYSITVRWIPDDNSTRKYEDCACTGNKLAEALEMVGTGSTLTHSRDISYEIVEDVLYFHVKYTVRMAKAVEAESKMKNVTVDEKTKESEE